MFNIGMSEMAMIAGLALILIGPRQLPEVARTLGRLINELKRSANVFTEEIKSQVQIDTRISRPRPIEPDPVQEPQVSPMDSAQSSVDTSVKTEASTNETTASTTNSSEEKKS